MKKWMLTMTCFLAGLCLATSVSKPILAANNNMDNQTSDSSSSSPSLDMAVALGTGWNLGNSFDSYDVNHDAGEMTWDNPEVTPELFKALKAEGFSSVRIPLTIFYRSGDASSGYQIDLDYLNRYRQVVDWALAVDLYVIINLHHDSVEWLNQWDGKQDSEPLQRYAAYWAQLATAFKDYDERLLFEAINEPRFYHLKLTQETLTEGVTQQTALDVLNAYFVQVVRRSGGQNVERMLLLPSLLSGTDQVQLEGLRQSIKSLNDANVLATVHYYGEWSFSNNVGYPLFDEALPNTSLTQRQLNEDFIQRLQQTFIAEGIGVVIGEYGLLGYDRSTQVNPWSETHKFIAHLNSLTRYQPISLFIWDNGQHFDRVQLTWYQEAFGELQRQAMHNDSAYVTGFGTTYREDPQADEFISLVYNGVELQQVLFNGDALQVGQDYEVNADGVYLYPDVMAEGGTLTLKFSQGATWNQQIVNVGQVEVFSFSANLDKQENNESAEGTDSDFESGNNNHDNEATHLNSANPSFESSVQIPIELSGHEIKRVQLIGENNHYQMLTYLEDYQLNQAENQLAFSVMFIDSLDEGSYQLIVETFSGIQVSYQVSLDGQTIIGKPN